VNNINNYAYYQISLKEKFSKYTPPVISGMKRGTDLFSSIKR